ncbi:MAG: bacterial regulatory, arsR family protein [Cyanobacteria bacterium RYN_339]|nr:bacterial regulatory, arsR family protein [Cyanobacteria bacterium RYN_339]
MIDVHLTTSRLGDLLGTLAHPHRLLLVIALEEGACDASTLTRKVGISQLGVMEHLRVLRAHHIVTERRENGRTSYELAWPGIVGWLTMGLAFIEGHLSVPAGRLVELPKAGGA